MRAPTGHDMRHAEQLPIIPAILHAIDVGQYPIILTRFVEIGPLQEQCSRETDQGSLQWTIADGTSVR